MSKYFVSINENVPDKTVFKIAMGKIKTFIFDLNPPESFLEEVQTMYDNLSTEFSLSGFERVGYKMFELGTKYPDVDMRICLSLVLKLNNLQQWFFNTLDENNTKHKKIQEMKEFNSFIIEDFELYKIVSLCKDILSRECDGRLTFMAFILLRIHNDPLAIKYTGNLNYVFINYLLEKNKDRKIELLKQLDNSSGDFIDLRQLYIEPIKKIDFIKHELLRINDTFLYKDLLLSQKNHYMLASIVESINLNLFPYESFKKILTSTFDKDNIFATKALFESLYDTNYPYTTQLIKYMIKQYSIKELTQLLFKNCTLKEADIEFIECCVIGRDHLRLLKREVLLAIIKNKYFTVLNTSLNIFKIFYEEVIEAGGSQQASLIRILCNSQTNEIEKDLNQLFYLAETLTSNREFILEAFTSLLKNTHPFILKDLLKLTLLLKNDKNSHKLIVILLNIDPTYFSTKLLESGIKLPLLFIYTLIRELDSIFDQLNNKKYIIEKLAALKFCSFNHSTNSFYNIILFKSLNLNNITSSEYYKELLYKEESVLESALSTKNTIIFKDNTSDVSIHPSIIEEIEESPQYHTLMNQYELSHYIKRTGISGNIKDRLDIMNKYEEGIVLYNSLFTLTNTMTRFSLYLNMVQYDSQEKQEIITLSGVCVNLKVYIADSKIIVSTIINNHKKDTTIQEYSLMNKVDVGIKFFHRTIKATINNYDINLHFGNINTITIGRNFKGILKNLFVYEALCYDKSILSEMDSETFYTKHLSQIEKKVQFKCVFGLYIKRLRPYHLNYNNKMEYKFTSTIENDNITLDDI